MSDKSLRLRRATPADVPALAVLVERAYFGAPDAQGWTNETKILSGPRSSAQELAKLVEGPGRVIVAEIEDRIRGCVSISATGDDAHLGMFAVDPHAQGAGLGKSLMAEGEWIARELFGAKRMVIEVVSPRTELIAWYERRGYARTGRRLPFPFDTEVTVALVEGIDLTEMAKELKSFLRQALL